MDPLEENKPFRLQLKAPGKVILFGEYSVVFNKPALAASVSLYTKLRFYETDSDTITINFSSLEVEKSFSLKNIKEYFKIIPSDPWDKYLESLKEALDCLYEKTYGIKDFTEPQKNSMVTFFHCFGKIIDSCKGFHLKIDSELPTGSGAGSSASFSVVLSAAALLYEFHREQNKNVSDLIRRNGDSSIGITEKFKNLISEMAFFCEKIFHGSPSGVDHSTILQGSLLQFTKSESGNKMSQISTCPIKILLVNTNVPRSTKALVQAVKQLRENHSEIIEHVLSAMEAVVKNAIKILENLKNSNEVNSLEVHFGELVSLNHNLLRVLGASHPSLEQIVSTAKKYHLNAKLTGAGGGGFGFIYLPSEVTSFVIQAIEKELTLAGFKVFEVTLGGPGLTVDEVVS